LQQMELAAQDLSSGVGWVLLCEPVANTSRHRPNQKLAGYQRRAAIFAARDQRSPLAVCVRAEPHRLNIRPVGWPRLLGGSALRIPEWFRGPSSNDADQADRRRLA